jgi:iron complex outermembrane receptor protein
MRSSTLFTGTAAGAIIAAAFVSAAGAQAQTKTAAAATADTAEELVVTGSFIRGTAKDAAVPVDVFTSEDLTASGISSPLEFIQNLPSVGAVLGNSNQFAVGSQGFQGVGSINLRGLGPDRTLVLLNGRRTIATPGFGFADTNLLPFFAVDRVEILKDGAAATYGSDAIAGVANFITKKNFSGVQVQGDYELIQGSRGNWTASVFAGHRFGKLSISGGIGWTHRSELGTTARAFTQLPYAVNPSGWSALGTPGLYAVTYGGVGAGTATVAEAGCAGVGGVQDGALCRFSFVPFDNLIEEEDRYQGILQADVDLSDRLRFHVEGTYSQSDLNSLGYSPSFPPTQGPRGSGSRAAFTVSPNNPGVPAFLAQNNQLPGTAARPLTAITAVFWRPLGWLGNPLDPVRGAGRGASNNKAYRISGGFDMDFTDSFRAQAYGTYWRSEREAFAPDIVGSRLQNALNGLGGPGCNPLTGTPGVGGCQYFNPFVNAGPSNPTLKLTNPLFVPGAQNSPELVGYLQVPVGTRQVEEQYVADLIFSGETKLDLGGGPIGYAFGFQYRSNAYTSRPLSAVSDLAVNPCFIEGDRSCVGTPIEGVGPFIFLGGSRPIAVNQSVYAFFGEVKVPVTNTLEVTAAARYEGYGGSVGSTFNPKGSVRWKPTDWLVLRGSIGTTFRAPLARQVGNISTTSLAGIQASANNFKSVDIFGNPNTLGPETALTYNLGVVVEQSGFTASVDYWSFDFSGRITTTPAQAIATAVSSGAVAANGTRFANCANVFADLITFQGGCVQGTTTGFDISRVRTDWVNGPKVKTSGLDFSLGYQRDIGPGNFSIGASGSYILRYDVADFIFRGQLVQAGYAAAGKANYFRDPGTISRIRATGYVNYNVSGVNMRYGVRYIGGVTDNRCFNATTGAAITPCFVTNFAGAGNGTNFGAKVKSFTQHDINLSYDLPFENVKAQLQFAVENFTNQAPSAARLEVGFDPFIGNPFLRTFRFGVKANF